jgi:hypothetical protein
MKTKHIIGTIIALPTVLADTASVLKGIGAFMDFIIAVLAITAIGYTVKLLTMDEEKERLRREEEERKKGKEPSYFGSIASNWFSEVLDSLGADSTTLKVLTGIYSLDDTKRELRTKKSDLMHHLDRTEETIKEIADKTRITFWLHHMQNEGPSRPAPLTQCFPFDNNWKKKHTSYIINTFEQDITKAAINHVSYSYSSTAIRKIVEDVLTHGKALNYLLAKAKAKKDASETSTIENLMKAVKDFERGKGQLINFITKTDEGMQTLSGKAVNAMLTDTTLTTAPTALDGNIKKTIERETATLVNNIKEAKLIVKKIPD